MQSKLRPNDADDRGWLYALVAFRIAAIDAATLAAVLRASRHATTAPLPLEPLIRQQARIDPQQDARISQIVDRYIQRHGGDAAAALASLERPHTTADATGSGDDSSADLVVEPSQDPADSANALIGHRYKIVRHLARGNLGEVYVALDTLLGREVALKQIRAELEHKPSLRGRFEAEARVTGRLDHPGVPPIYTLGVDASGCPFYTMRLIKGVSLRAAIKHLHDASPRRAGHTEFHTGLRGLIVRFMAACQAVAHAHSRGVIHRDLKPANIMLGEYGETLVVDWGLARAADAPQVESTAPTLVAPTNNDTTNPSDSTPGVKGTPAFMSPEQARGEPATAASDIFCLGATLYAILTGQPPFAYGSTEEVLRAVRSGSFPAPRQVRKDVPPALEAICAKAMKPRPIDRFATVADLVAELERWIDDEAIESAPEPFDQRVWRFARRHRLAVGMGLAALLALASASLPLAYLYSQNQAVLRDRERALLVAEQARNEALAHEQRTALAWKRDAQHVDQLRQVLMSDVETVAESLTSAPRADAVRALLLDRAVGHYESFLEARPRDLALAREAARACWYAANLCAELEADPDRATALYQRATALAQRVADSSNRRSDDRLVARVRHDQALWQLARGDFANAQEALHAALDRLPPEGAPAGTSLDDRNDRQIEARLWVALARAHIGSVLHLPLCPAPATNRALLPTEPAYEPKLSASAIDALTHAASQVQRAESLFSTLTLAPNASPVDQILHANSLLLKSQIELALHRPAAALDSLERARKTMESLNQPGRLAFDHAEISAAIDLQAALIAASSEETAADAARWIDQAIAALEQLAEQHPSAPSIRRSLAQAYQQASLLALIERRLPEAERLARRATTLMARQSSDRPLGFADLEIVAHSQFIVAEVATASGQEELAFNARDLAIAAYEAATKLAPQDSTLAAMRDLARLKRGSKPSEPPKQLNQDSPAGGCAGQKAADPEI